MVKDPIKNALITALNNAQGDIGVKNALTLAGILLEEAREENDEAEGNQYYRNQGKIKAYKEFMEVIRRGVPAV